jgi:hypothetical protein
MLLPSSATRPRLDLVFYRVPGLSRPALLILFVRRHATIERLQVGPIWLPPGLRMLRREKHRDANQRLPLPCGQSTGGPAWLNLQKEELDL